ncbi:MAG: hypothetical protein ACRDOI_47180 [Trebonia sp.]
MQTIIAQSAPAAHANPDAAASQRAARLARATAAEMHAALAFLGMIDADAFEIAFTAVGGDQSRDDHPEDEEAVPACRACGNVLGIFPEHGLGWQHFRGAGVTSGAQVIFDPGHAPEVVWCLPDEDPAEL